MHQRRSLLLGLIGAVVAIFTLQNLQTSTVTFFSWSVSPPTALLVILMFALGLLAGPALGALLRHRRAGLRS